MKNKSILYSLSLFIIAISIFLVVEFHDSGRMNLIAGILALFGFGINAAVFFSKETEK